jgi:putative oxidoreductase
MKRWILRSLRSTAPRAIVLVRVLVGLVFVSEGAQKFLFPATLGAGRFLKIGLPAPEALASFVGVIELGCGALILVGLATRLAAVPLIIDMIVAFASTKIPMWLHGGFWVMAHEARTDISMLLASTCLLIIGAGAWSLDARIAGDGEP